MVKKTAKNAKPKTAAKEKKAKPIGVVTHYYGGLEVAIVKFNKTVEKGAAVAFKGHTTDFEQTVDSMQYDHKAVDAAKKGQEVGIKVKDKVREGDEVFEA